MAQGVYELLNNIPRNVVDAFGASSAALLLDSRPQPYFSDIAGQSVLSVEDLQTVSGRGEPVIDRERGVCYLPLRLGVRSVGSIGISGCQMSRETLDAIGSLAAIAIESAGTVEKLTKAEAARESDRLRTVLLDAVTHEFRTPLTAIKASAETLQSDAALDPAQRQELLAVINEESDRLNRLIGEAAEVAQLDAHQVELHASPQDIREAIDAAVEQTRQVLAQHPLEVVVPDGLPPVRMDLERVTEVLQQLLENAGKYSPLARACTSPPSCAARSWSPAWPITVPESTSSTSR